MKKPFKTLKTDGETQQDSNYSSDSSLRKSPCQRMKFPKDFISINDLSKAQLNYILDLTLHYKKLTTNYKQINCLANHKIAMLFTENSTRTQFSFQIACNFLGASVISAGSQSLSLSKGEDLFDTAMTISNMLISGLIIRCEDNEVIKKISQAAKIPIINAGTGYLNHPSQALGDACLLYDLHGHNWLNKKIVIMGDLQHSRVMRSFTQLIHKLGGKVFLCGPQQPTMMNYDYDFHHDPKIALQNADYVICLRPQLERHEKKHALHALTDFTNYKMDLSKLIHCHKNVKLLHPGPANYLMDISKDLAVDKNYSLINQQIHYGVLTRMAILDCFLNLKQII